MHVPLYPGQALMHVCKQGKRLMEWALSMCQKSLDQFQVYSYSPTYITCMAQYSHEHFFVLFTNFVPFRNLAARLQNSSRTGQASCVPMENFQRVRKPFLAQWAGYWGKKQSRRMHYIYILRPTYTGQLLLRNCVAQQKLQVALNFSTRNNYHAASDKKQSRCPHTRCSYAGRNPSNCAKQTTNPLFVLSVQQWLSWSYARVQTAKKS